jgi:hypothetical protein
MKFKIKTFAISLLDKAAMYVGFFARQKYKRLFGCAAIAARPS